MDLATLFLLAVSGLVPSSAPGAVHRVGPTQFFATIQQAVDVAVTGDLILVDPGSYPEFAVRGKGVSIVAQSTLFTVLESSSSSPAILVEDIGASDQVTIVGAHVDHGVSANTPAVLVRNNPGAVRFSSLEVREVQDLIGTAARAALQVEHTRTFWLIDSVVWSPVPRQADRAGGTGFDEVVSGLELLESNGVIQNVRLRGYDAGLAYGGDGVRVVGTSSLWIIDDLDRSPQKSILQGGAGDYGGSALHYFGPLSNRFRMTSCGIVLFIGGAGTVQEGGYYAINGDFGLYGGASNEVWRLPKACSNLQFSSTTVASSTASIGSTINVRVWTYAPRRFLTVMTAGTRYMLRLYALAGRPLLDYGSPVRVILGGGVTPGAAAVTLQAFIPNQLALIGSQVSFQSVIGPVGSGPLETLTHPALVVVTP